jgi:cytochrome b6-f complex iron-sulfur subunit
VSTDAQPIPTGKAIERAAVIERTKGDLVPTETAPPAPYVPPDPEEIGVNRRQFLNRSIVGGFALSLSGFGAACIAFVWPKGGEGFGADFDLGLISDVITEIRENNGFLYKPEGRLWVTEYPAGALEKAAAVYPDNVMSGMKEGVVALYQKCPHLGCRVPECETSQWFECPCHGSQYNRVGEKRGGPAPRGMDHFAMDVSSGNLVVATGTIINGPPIGTNTTGQEAEGPHCLGESDH